MTYISKVLAALVIVLLLGNFSKAQDVPAYAMSNVEIHFTDGKSIKSGTIVWRNGIIEAVGKDVAIPFDAYTINGGDSLHIYPGFIDGFSTWGSPKIPTDLKRLPNPGTPSYDRAGVQPERIPSKFLEEDKEFSNALKTGFTTAGLGMKGNMLSGQVEVFSLSSDYNEVSLQSDPIALHGSFEIAPGNGNTRAYPSTQMSVMATFRQVMYDAQALKTHIQYHKANAEMPAPQRSEVLEALFPLIDKSKPLFFTVDQKEDIERLFQYQDEFGFKMVIVSGKEAYAKASELKERNIPVLASINVVEAPTWVSAKEDSTKPHKEISKEEQNYRERQLSAWMNSVKNIRVLVDEGVSVGYASEGIGLKDFSKKVKLLLDDGQLTEGELIKIMTTNTAEILNINSRFGTLSKGKNASFTVFSKPVFSKKTRVVKSVSNGTIYEF